MRKHRWGICSLIIILGALLLGGSGCTCYRTGQGWVMQPCCWSLEFKRAPCSCAGAMECNTECAAVIPKEPSCTSAGDGACEGLPQASPNEVAQPNSSSCAGRLGIRANCAALRLV